MKTNLEKTIASGIEALQAEKFKEAQALFQTALKEAESSQDRLLAAHCLDQLGETYFQQDQYGQAEPYYAQAYQIRRQLLTPGHEDIVSSLNNLSAVYFFQGKHDLSKPLCEQLMAIYQTVLGRDHPEIATCMINLGLIAMAEGKFGQAEKYYLQAHRIRLSSFGRQHTLVGNSLSHLGSVYLEQQRFAEASDALRKSVAILEKNLGHEHPDLGKVLNNLIEALEAEGKGTEAEQLCPRLVSLKEISLGPAHPKVVACLEKVAAFYLRQNKPEESAKLYQRLLAMKRRTYGNDHPEVARQLTNLAFAEQSLKLPAQAEPLFLQALHIYENNSRQSSGNVAVTHAQFLTALRNLATFYDTDRRFSKSEKEWRRFVQLAEASPDKYADMLITGYDRLASCLIEQNKSDEAQTILRKALQFQNNKIKDGIKSSAAIYQQASFLTKLANILKQEHRFAEAELHYKEALDGLVKVLGATHKDLAPTMEGYADLLALTYREAEAEHMRACTRSLIEKK